MTDIHKLHIDLMEKRTNEWVNEKGGSASEWLEPALATYADIAEILKHTKESLLYHYGCGGCNMVINEYLKRNQPTIEILERRISELEMEVEKINHET